METYFVFLRYIQRSIILYSRVAEHVSNLDMCEEKYRITFLYEVVLGLLHTDLDVALSMKSN